MNPISPLHQALVGTTALPPDSCSMPNDHVPQQPNINPNAHLPQEPYIAQNAYTMQKPSYHYYTAREAPPQQLPPNHTPAIQASTFASQNEFPIFPISAQHNEFPTFPINAQHNEFPTLPRNDYPNLFNQDQILTMDPPSITSSSLLQVGATASLHAPFNTNGVLDPIPYPALQNIYQVHLITLVPLSLILKLRILTLNCMQVEELRPSNIDPYGQIPYGNQTYFGQIPTSSYARIGQTVHIGVPTGRFGDLVPPTLSSATKGELLYHKVFKCRLCDSLFTSPQAFGGHMSGHSKQKKKN
jgi:hypothetical protein